MSTFRRRAVDPSRVALAEDAAAQSPLVQGAAQGAVPPAPVQDFHDGAAEGPISAVRANPSVRDSAPDQAASAPTKRPSSAAPVSSVSSVSSGLGHLGSIQEPASMLSSWAVGEVREVPLHLIRSNPQPPREIYTARMIDEMALSLSQKGQNIAATGFLSDDGAAIVLIEGETRLRGARQAGLAHLRVEIKVRPADDRALYEQARSSNVDRRDQSPLDDALCWRRLLDSGTYPTQVALAKALGCEEDHVSNTLSLASIPRAVIRVVSDFPALMTGRMLLALRKFCEIRGEDETIDLIQEIDRLGLGYRDVDSRRKAAEAGPVKRPRAQAESVTFKGCRGEIKMFDGGKRLELSLKGLTPEKADLLAVRLRNLFQSEAADAEAD